MTYLTITMAYNALSNELSVCQAQLIAVRKKLNKNWTTICAYRNDPCSDILRNTEIQDIEKKCNALRKIEEELTNKESCLANAIDDFKKHNW